MSFIMRGSIFIVQPCLTLIKRQHTESGTIRQHNIRDYIMVYMLACVFYPLAVLCLCSPPLIVIPVTVHFSVVWETTRRQH